MIGSPAFIPELAAIARRGPTPRRVETISRLADLFEAGADQFQPDHIQLFDQVFTGLVTDSAPQVRADLARRMAAFANAPPGLVGQLATEDDIRVAAPLLRRSERLDDATLVSIARQKSQQHLFAIAERARVSAAVTDVVVRRGDRDVTRRVASNEGAAFSIQGFSGLLKRARGDGVLTLQIGNRTDLTPGQLKTLLGDAPDILRRRLAASASPERRAAIEHIAMTGDMPPQAIRRDFTAAMRNILALHRKGQLDDSALWNFARERRYEESIAALAAMANVTPDVADRLVTDTERPDSILLLSRAIGLEWDIVRALVLLRFTRGAPSVADIETARSNYERIAPATAQRVLRFWQMTRG